MGGCVRLRDTLPCEPRDRKHPANRTGPHLRADLYTPSTQGISYARETYLPSGQEVLFQFVPIEIEIPDETPRGAWMVEIRSDGWAYKPLIVPSLEDAMFAAANWSPPIRVTFSKLIEAERALTSLTQRVDAQMNDEAWQRARLALRLLRDALGDPAGDR